MVVWACWWRCMRRNSKQPACHHFAQQLPVTPALQKQELTAAREALQLSLDTTSQQRDALESEAGQLKARLSELVTVQQELAELWVEHGAVTSRVAQLEEEHEVRVEGGM